MKRAGLRDANLEEQLLRDGFILIRNFLSSKEVHNLYSLYKEYHAVSEAGQGMWNSLYDIPANESSYISQQILKVLQPGLEKIFISYHAPVGTFMSKNCNPLSACQIHRDFSIQDEDNFQYRNLWIPLVKTNKDNGALFALKGSNHVFNHVMPMFTEWPYKFMQQELIEMAEVIYANAGDLVIYLDRTLHGSMINCSGDSRPVVHLGALNPDNQLCFYYHDHETGKVRVYEVPFDFFFQKDFSDPGKKYPLVREFIFNPPVLDIEAVRAGLAKYAEVA